MIAPQARRETRRELTDRLVEEYAGIVPAGRVLAAVLRADRALPVLRADDRPDRLAMCESLARSLLI